jgi:hypothetical protein
MSAITGGRVGHVFAKVGFCPYLYGMDIEFHHSFARDVPHGVLDQTPDAAPDPAVVLLNEGLAQALHLPLERLRAHGAQWFSGASWPQGAVPRAMACGSGCNAAASAAGSSGCHTVQSRTG